MRLRVLEPCDENWDTMESTAVGRRCPTCRREVHDLTALSAREAERLLRSPAGPRPCVRMRVDEDGFAVFRREPPRLGPAVAAMVLAACAPPTPEAQRLEPAVEVEVTAFARPVPVIPEARAAAAEAPSPPKPVKPSAKKPGRERVLMGDPWDG